MRNFTILLAGLFLPLVMTGQTLPKGMANLTGAGVTLTVDAKGNIAKKNMVTVGDLVFFTASDATNGEELWVSDGTVAGTHIVKDINPGTDGSNPSYLCAAGGQVYFSATTPDYGAELWVSDGTDAGTMLAADIFTGTDGSYPMNLTAMGSNNDLIVFAAQDNNSVLDSKWYLYLYDTNNGQLKLLLDQQPHLAGDSYYGFLVPFQQTHVYFACESDSFGVELYKADTSVMSGKLVKDIMDDPAPGKPSGYTIGGNLEWIYNYKDSLILFRTTTPAKYSDSASAYVDNIGEEIWYTDGNTVNFLGDLNPAKNVDGTGQGTQYAWPVTFNGKFIFRADAGDGTNVEPRTSDFTLAGTKIISDINPGNNPSWPQWWAEFKGRLFFMGDDGGTVAGAELRDYDGVNPPELFYDVVPGPNSSWLEQCTTVKTKEGQDTLLYFVAPYTAKELWVVTGLDKKAYSVGSLAPGGSNPFDLTPLNGSIYFTTGAYPSLFKYDYTPVFNIMPNQETDLSEAKHDTVRFRLKFINPLGINTNAAWINFTAPGDWKVSLGGDDTYASTKRLYVSSIPASQDTIINVLVGSLDANSWIQNLVVNATYLDPSSVVDTIKITSQFKMEPPYNDSVLFYVKIGAMVPKHLNPIFEQMGSLQSTTDQPYQNDTLADQSIVKWGHSGEIGGATWWDADRYSEFIYTANGTDNHLAYSFPLPTGQYHIRMALTSPQWTQSRPSTFVYPGVSEYQDINAKLVIIDTVLNYEKGSDSTFNVSWTSTLNSGLVIGGFMKIGVKSSANSIATYKSGSNDLSVYPNPSNGMVNVTFRKPVYNASIEVFDLTGRLVQSVKLNGNATILNLVNNANGMYFIKVSTSDNVQVQRILLSK